ncbi:hypothetical protein E2542_SST02346 [Spatholobus suberectus]|nr:hypothetical protein E2542_SST02346 [Spatholobus suberectus]
MNSFNLVVWQLLYVLYFLKCNYQFSESGSYDGIRGVGGGDGEDDSGGDGEDDSDGDNEDDSGGNNDDDNDDSDSNSDDGGGGEGCDNDSGDGGGGSTGDIDNRGGDDNVVSKQRRVWNVERCIAHILQRPTVASALYGSTKLTETFPSKLRESPTFVSEKGSLAETPHQPVTTHSASCHNGEWEPKSNKPLNPQPNQNHVPSSQRSHPRAGSSHEPRPLAFMTFTVLPLPTLLFLSVPRPFLSRIQHRPLKFFNNPLPTLPFLFSFFLEQNNVCLYFLLAYQLALQGRETSVPQWD